MPGTSATLAVIVRLDFSDNDDLVIPADPSRWTTHVGEGTCPNGITLTKAYEDWNVAEAEVARLNALAAREGKGCQYFVQGARLKRPGTQES